MKALPLVVFALLFMKLFSWWYVKPPKPPAFHAITQQEIIRGYKHDRRKSAIKRAIKEVTAVFRRHHCKTDHVDLIAEAAVEKNISPRILAAVVFAESSNRSGIISKTGCVGLMQVSAKTWHYTRNELQDPAKNLQAGTNILVHYIHLYGLKKGLHAYNGFGNPTDEYSNHIFQIAGYSVPA